VTVVDAGSGGPARDRWDALPPVSLSMLNPALLALVIAAAAGGHRRETGMGLPWALSFIVAPLVLHRGTREALPNQIRTHLPTWVSREPVIRAGFPGRAASLVAPVRGGLRLGLRSGVLILSGDRIETVLRSVRASEPQLENLLAKATFSGRWLSKLDQSSTAFALFGVTV
jgi:hypothetical protein